MKQETDAADDRATALLRVAAYLGQPQKFMAVADARAEMRRTLELATKGSVVLTTHGEPEAAVVPFTTLEDMRRALLHLLVAEMDRTLAQAQERLRSRLAEVPVSTEEEIERLVGEALHKARRSGKSSGRTSRG